MAKVCLKQEMGFEITINRLRSNIHLTICL